MVVAFGTAIASFIYEISWIRMLSLLLGSATHSFELMLSAFILGLALGARWVRSRADRFADPVRALGIVQCVMGLAALATIPVYLAGFQWTATFISALKLNDGGYELFTLARYFACLVVMLPSTFCAGMTLPLITRMLMRRGDGERAIGNVYAVNTLGSIVGVVLAGLVLHAAARAQGAARRGRGDRHGARRRAAPAVGAERAAAAAARVPRRVRDDARRARVAAGSITSTR